MAQSLLTSLATLFGSPLLSDCQVVFHDKLNNANGISCSSDAPADAPVGDAGLRVLHCLPAHMLAVWSGSALFRAQFERWPAPAAIGASTGTATVAAAAVALPATQAQPRPQQLRVVLEGPSDLPYALDALRYLYTSNVQHVSGGAAGLLHVRRLAGYLQIPECVTACEEALVALVGESTTAASAADRKTTAGAAAVVAPAAGGAAPAAAAAAAAAVAMGARAAGAAGASGLAAAAASLPPPALPAAVVDVYLATRALLDEGEAYDDPEEIRTLEELEAEEDTDAQSEPDDEEESEELDESFPSMDGWVGYGGQPGETDGAAGPAATTALLARLRLACVKQLVAWAQANEQVREARRGSTPLLLGATFA